MVSEMVRLNCVSLAERALVPAFVFFFFMLYPPEWVKKPERRTAAAAGGCNLVRSQALKEIGDREAIGPLIDALITKHKVKVSDANPDQHRIPFEDSTVTSEIG